MTSATCVLSSEPAPVARGRAWALGETAAIFIVFFLFAASPPPAANEYSLPAPADASKGEDKKEEAKPMPPAAPTAPPAEGVKK